MHDKYYSIVSYRYNIPPDITDNTTNMIDPAELQFNSATVHYVKLPPYIDNDNNGPNNYNADTDNNYTVVKNYINNILRVIIIFIVIKHYGISKYSPMTTFMYHIDQPQRLPRVFYEQQSELTPTTTITSPLITINNLFHIHNNCFPKHIPISVIYSFILLYSNDWQGNFYITTQYIKFDGYVITSFCEMKLNYNNGMETIQFSFSLMTI